MGLCTSKRVVEKSLRDSGDFNSACDSAFNHCVDLTQHVFQGVLPYQLKTASDYIHANTTHPLIRKWVPAPPDRSQIHAALPPNSDETLPLPLLLFKNWAHRLYTNAVLSAASKALMLRLPVAVAGIAGIAALTRPPPQLLRPFLGASSLAVALSVFLALSP